MAAAESRVLAIGTGTGIGVLTILVVVVVAILAGVVVARWADLTPTRAEAGCGVRRTLPPSLRDVTQRDSVHDDPRSSARRAPVGEEARMSTTTRDGAHRFVSRDRQGACSHRLTGMPWRPPGRRAEVTARSVIHRPRCSDTLVSQFTEGP
ncbi:hypothetical protein ASG41_16425 [Modestobacter sp. Leaf380]|nr:hypothetical protein ASG41_16425 [Modestobacter sp. Leaf380]